MAFYLDNGRKFPFCIIHVSVHRFSSQHLPSAQETRYNIRQATDRIIYYMPKTHVILLMETKTNSKYRHNFGLVEKIL